MIDIKLKTNEVFELLKDYIASKSKYCNKVVQSNINLTYPMVVFSELGNTKASQTIDKRQTIRNLSFQIDIYTVNNENISSLVIADEIKQYVVELMEGYFNMKGGYENQLLNINSAKATQTILRYNCQWFVEKNLIL